MPIGWPELVLLLVILLILFGAGRLAGVGGALGRSIRDFRSEATDDRESDAAPTDTRATTGADVARRDVAETR